MGPIPWQERRYDKSTTVKVDIFAQYMFSGILHRALDAQKFDVCENYNHNRTN